MSATDEIARLTTERDAARAAAKGLAEALRDMSSGWDYIRGRYGDLAGVGWIRAADKADTALAAYEATGAGSFQSRVDPWMQACFGPEISADRVERGDRLVEEVFELLQSGGYDRARATALIDYVWSRPAGEPAQEVGGVMVTLAAYCLAHNLDMHAAGEVELARIWTKIEQIRAKQAAKPTGSALPIATGDEE